MSNKQKGLYKFADYVLNAKENNLWRENELVHLSPRVFDTLKMLVERSGEVISKEEMMEEIWDDSFVEENNLSQKISILRKTFGKENNFIETVPRKGFRFVEPVEFFEQFERTQKRKIESPVFEAIDKTNWEETLNVEDISGEHQDKPQPKPAEVSPTKSNLRLVVPLVLGIVALGAVLAFYFNSTYFSANDSKEIKSIAVMPFEINNNQDENTAYLSDGITESLIINLSRLSKVSVKSRNSVFHYKNKLVSPKKIGQELNVQTILLGKINKNGDELITNLEFVDTQTENIIWAKTYRHKANNLYAFQTDIAFDVSKNIGLKLTSSDEKLITKTYTKNSEANDLYLRGRYFLNKRNIKSLQKAVEFFEQSIEKDPTFALAYSGLADSLILFPAYGGFSPQEFYPKAKQAATKAVELDGDLAETHTSLGQILWYYDFDWKAAEREFRRAIELNPNYPSAHQWLGEVLTNQGQHEKGIEQLKTVLELDPFSIIGNTILGKNYLLARRYDEAIRQLNKTVELDSNSPLAFYYLAETHFAKRNYAESIKNFSILQKKFGIPEEKIKSFEEAFQKGGWKAHQRLILKYILEERKKADKNNSSPVFNDFSVAVTYARLGEKEKAFEYIDKGIENRDPAFLLLKVLPTFDSLKNENKYAELINKVNLQNKTN